MIPALKTMDRPRLRLVTGLPGPIVPSSTLWLISGVPFLFRRWTEAEWSRLGASDRPALAQQADDGSWHSVDERK